MPSAKSSPSEPEENGLDLLIAGLRAHAHDAALAERALNLGKRRFQGLCLVHVLFLPRFSPADRRGFRGGTIPQGREGRNSALETVKEEFFICSQAARIARTFQDVPTASPTASAQARTRLSKLYGLARIRMSRSSWLRALAG